MRIAEDKKTVEDILNSLKVDMGKLADEAVKHDGWMTPTEDNIELPYDKYDEKEISGWSETLQYEIRWRKRITQALYDALQKNDMEELWNDVEWRCQARGELEDAFWDAWAEGHKLYDFWKKHHKKERKHGKKVKKS